MGKGKLIAGIIILVIGVGLIPASLGMNNLLERRMDESVIVSMTEIRDDLLPYTYAMAYADAIPGALLTIKSVVEPDIPELVNGSVSAKGISDLIDDLGGFIGTDNASDWFFNDPAFTVNTDGNYSIQGISEYAGYGNLSFSSAAQDAFLNRFRVGTGFYSFLSEVERVPTEIGQYYDGGEAQAVYISGNYAYVADGSDGLEILNISDPENPTQVGVHYDGGVAYGVVVSGVLAYVADGTDGLEIVNVTDPENPTLISQYINGTADAYNVVVSGDYAYVADGTDGLEIIDITNSSDPYRVGHFYNGGEAYGVAVSGDYAYVADGSDGLEILNITVKTAPTEIVQIDDGGIANDVVVSGAYAYVADGTHGLEILHNITDDTAYEIGQFDNGGLASGVIYSSGYAYVADGSDGFEIISVSNPAHPYLVGQFYDGATALGVRKVGNYVYIADGVDGLEIFDVTYPNGAYVVESQYDSTLSQVLNVSDYVENHLFASVPILGGFPFEATPDHSEDFFLIQWANLTLVPGSLEVEVFGENYEDWETRVYNLTLTQAQALWDTSNTTSPLNVEGSQLWLESFTDSDVETELKSIYNLTDYQFNRLKLYFTDDDLLEVIVAPLYLALNDRTIRSLAFDKIYLQWADGEIFPDNVTFLNPLFIGFEVCTPPEKSGIDPGTAALLWGGSILHSIRNVTGNRMWFDAARQTNPTDSEYYYLLRDEFGLNDTQMEYLLSWLIEFRPHAVNIIDETYQLDYHPIEMMVLLRTGMYITSGIVGFIGLIFIITSFRKER